MFKFLEKQTRSVKTLRLLKHNSISHQTRMPVYDVVGTKKGQLGVLKLNKEHRHNILTPTLLAQLERGLKTMEIDHTV